LEGFGITLHNNIHSWFKEENNLKLWKELQKMIDIEKKDAPATSEGVGSPFAGCTIVATGKLVHFTRSSINAKIEALGATAGSAVTKDTNYLICGEKAGSKLDKARSLGVTVLSEQEFLEMAEGA